MSNRHLYRTISIPRSGNVLLLRYVHAYRRLSLGIPTTDYAYDFSAQSEQPFLHSRSHDTDLTEERDITGVVTVIQYREPIEQALSYVDYLELNNPGLFSSTGQRTVHKILAAHAQYFVHFCKKWLASPPDGAQIVPYPTLVADPLSVLRSIFLSIGQPFSESLFGKAYEIVSPVTTRGKKSEIFRPRDLNSSAFASVQVVRDFDSYVRQETPWMQWSEPTYPDDPDRVFRFAELVARPDSG